MKKYLVTRSDDHPNLGGFIRNYLYDYQTNRKNIYTKMGVSHKTFFEYLKQSSFQFTILWRICKGVNYNFLMELGERLAIPYETKVEKGLKEKITAIEKENEVLKIENELLKKIMKQ